MRISLILAGPDFEQPSVIYCDASAMVFGADLC